MADVSLFVQGGFPHSTKCHYRVYFQRALQEVKSCGRVKVLFETWCNILVPEARESAAAAAGMGCRTCCLGMLAWKNGCEN